MFNSIQGEITEKLGGAVFIKTGGLEWEINMPLRDIDALPAAGEEARVWLWLCHREDSMTLYGFAGEVRRATFLELLKVEGIGPKGAVKILGGISQSELERAIENEDLARLESVPGLGKKTAQKLLLALKGKIVRAPEKTAGGKETPFSDLVNALVDMGYEKRAAAAALEKAAAALGDAAKSKDSENELFRRAILSLTT